MRKAEVIIGINKAPKVAIDGIGTMLLSLFAQEIYKSNRIGWDFVMQCEKIGLTDAYATQLLNENIDLFPSDF